MEYKYITMEASTGLPVTLVTHDPKIVEKSLRLRIKMCLANFRKESFNSSDIDMVIKSLDRLRMALRMIELDIYGEVQ